MSSHLDLNLLVVFDAVMTERNLRLAGERLNRSQPAVSQAIARLRDITGDRLFERIPTGIAPTPRAEILWAEVRDPLSQLTRTMTASDFDPVRITGEIVLGLSDDIRIMFGANIAAALVEKAPNATVRLLGANHTSVWEDLGKGIYDLAITVSGQAPPGFASRILHQDQFVLLHRADRTPPKTAAAYAKCHQLALVFSEEQPAYADEALEAEGQRRSVVVRTSRFDSLAPMVKRLDAVVALPALFANHLTRDVELKASPLPVQFPPAIAKLCWNQRTRNDQQNIWVREVVFDTASKEISHSAHHAQLP